ncbi:MAG: ABC-type polysaccharide/polyol phosphate transport system ATPase subunit, partial [Paracoccaceae bacterium]
FKQRAAALLNERLTTKGAIVVTHSKRLVKSICDSVALMENGQITHYDDVIAGLRAYQALSDTETG